MFLTFAPAAGAQADAFAPVANPQPQQQQDGGNAGLWGLLGLTGLLGLAGLRKQQHHRSDVHARSGGSSRGDVI
ncbi:hypothetical protein GCM10010466_57870 [Planomonospora alba]|uniref:Uncharacterized protein n=1 Tax=Planomonospora alba TaxID=161354 RepID=A0ABP6NVF7_9ACTN